MIGLIGPAFKGIELDLLGRINLNKLKTQAQG